MIEKDQYLRCFSFLFHKNKVPVTFVFLYTNWRFLCLTFAATISHFVYILTVKYQGNVQLLVSFICQSYFIEYLRLHLKNVLMTYMYIVPQIKYHFYRRVTVILAFSKGKTYLT